MARAPGDGSIVVVQRESVWWVDLDLTRGAEIRRTRPAVVLSAEGLNPHGERW
jgi:mRNA-degrading endonuclease toxin of MazEF toxin-antitoxin module